MNMHMLSMLSIANWEPSVLAKYWALCHFIHEKGAAEGGYTVGCANREGKSTANGVERT